MRQRPAGDETGASAVEYGLLVGAIAAVIVIVLFLLGNVVQETFQKTCDNVRAEAITTETC